MEFDEKKPDVIVAMLSDLAERVAFDKTVTCSGGVEIWLNSLLYQVKDQIKSIIATMGVWLKDPEFDFIKNFPSVCGQVRMPFKKKVFIIIINKLKLF